MKKAKGKTMRALFVAVLLFTLTLVSISALFAQGTPSGLPNEALEELKEKLSTRAADVQKNLREKRSVFIGPIREINDNKLTIITKNGARTITISSETSIIEDGTPATQEALTEGQRAVVLGKEDGTLQATKILIPKEMPPVRAIMGTVTEIALLSDGKQKYTVRRLGKDDVFLLTLDAHVAISLRGGAGASIDALAKGSVIVAAGHEEEIGTLRTTRLVILSGLQSEIREKPQATTSAQAQELLRKVHTRLAAYRGAAKDLFELVSFTAQTWGDASLGVPQAGNVYAQVLTPGYKMTFQSPAQLYEIHTDETGKTVILVEPYAILE